MCPFGGVNFDDPSWDPTYLSGHGYLQVSGGGKDDGVKARRHLCVPLIWASSLSSSEVGTLEPAYRTPPPWPTSGSILSKIYSSRHWLKQLGQVLISNNFHSREESSMNWAPLGFVQRWLGILKGECGNRQRVSRGRKGEITKGWSV